MVMHARKPQRISDGYFEKHQTHPYQNSKYSGSKGNYDSRYNHERARDSPGSNSYRSDSPDLQSPRDRDRNYQSSKSLYMQKIQKERENRDYKPRDKYSECNRSPKDRRSRDAEHRTNHDRSCSVEKVMLHPVKSSSQNSSSREVSSRDISSRDLSSRDMSRDSMRESSSRDSSLRDSIQRKPLQNSCPEKREPERPPRVGDWSEHISSSGKKYYYNCKTEVSQWEKPREWLEKERERATREKQQMERSYSNNSSSSCGSSNTIIGRPSHDKHSNSRPLNNNSRDVLMKAVPSASTSRQGEKRDGYWNSQSGGEGENHDRKKLLDGELLSQDMDISPGDSTPTSETSYPPVSHPGESMVLLPGALPRLASHPPHQVSHASPQTPVSMRVPYQQHMSLPGGKPLEQAEMNTQAAIQTLQNALMLSRQGSGEQQVMPADQASPQMMQPLKVDTNEGAPIGEGPPTPTHSESLDCVDARKLASPPCSLSSLQSLTQASVASSLHALRPQGPHLTPSLANHYRDDLVNHVRGWPADVLEKQAQKLAEENHVMGSLHCTKVSADLKVARSIVRLTEIQATLQEQRILFLRQQIESLQQLKSHNAFMCDDS